MYTDRQGTWLGRARRARGYSWFSLPKTPSALLSVFILGVVVFTVSVFVGWYVGANIDSSPDSPLGYAFALVGSAFFVTALLLYWRKRRSHRRTIGQLHAALNWHVLFGLLALFFLVLHSFGNFNARSGTYALYGMIALAVSGGIGRFLDRILPHLGTREVHSALTAQGEDRIDAITQQLAVFSPRSLPHGSLFPYQWKDQETPPDREETSDHMQVLQQVQRALQREQVYRYALRYWRVFHRLLALVTTGLILWHLVYAAQLLLPH